MTTNVSSYNSSGCGGCGSGGGNAYPAYSRMFVGSIEPCVNNGAIQLNLGQVTVNGTTNTTTVNGILDAKGSITTPDLDVTGTLNTTGPITAQEIITPELTVRTGTKDILVVTNNEVDIDALTTVYGDINQPMGSITTSMINSTNCQIGDSFFGYLTYDETTNELKVTDDTNSVNISTTSITAPGNIVCNMLGAGVANPTEKIDVLGNIKASGTITAGSSLALNGAITQSLTAYPPSLTTQIGYSTVQTLAADIDIGALASGTVKRVTTAVTLPPGVWLLDGVVGLSQSGTTSATIDTVTIGFNSSSTEALPTSTSTTWRQVAFHPDVVTAGGTARTWPVLPLMQTLVLSASTSNISLFAAVHFTSNTGTLSIRGLVSQARFTRIA